MKQVAWGYVTRDIGNGKELLIATRSNKNDPLRIGEYVIPGGGLNGSENYIAAAIREVKEETGVAARYDPNIQLKLSPGIFDVQGMKAHIDDSGFVFLHYLDSGKSYQGKIIILYPVDPFQAPVENTESDARNPRYSNDVYIRSNFDKFTPACRTLLKILEF